MLLSSMAENNLSDTTSRRGLRPVEMAPSGQLSSKVIVEEKLLYGRIIERQNNNLYNYHFDLQWF